MWKNGSDSRCLAAALLGLAAKGVIAIEKTGRSFRLIPGTIDESLSREEGALAHVLFEAGGPVDLEGRQGHRLVTEMKNVLGQALGEEFKDVYFSFNLKYALPGNAVAVLTAGPYAVVLAPDIETGLGMVLFICLGVWGVNEWVQRTRQSIGGLIKRKGCLISFLLFMAVFGATTFLLFVPGLLFPILLTPLVCLLFMSLMAAPTAPGRRLMVQIDGFRLFLDVTERQNLNLFPDFKDAPEGAAKQMPYLLALDVGHPWTDAFADTLGGLWKKTFVRVIKAQ